VERDGHSELLETFNASASMWISREMQSAPAPLAVAGSGRTLSRTDGSWRLGLVGIGLLLFSIVLEVASLNPDPAENFGRLGSTIGFWLGLIGLGFCFLGAIELARNP